MVKRVQVFGFGVLAVSLVCSPLSSQTQKVLWSRNYGGEGWDLCRCMQETDDGGFVIGGSYHHVSNDDRDFYVVRTNPKGDVLWESIFGDSVSNIVLSIDEVEDGGFILCGYSGIYIGEAKAVLVRLDAAGDSLWAKTFTFVPYFNEFCAVQQTTDGGYFTAGNAREVVGLDWQTVIVKFDAYGDTVWTKIYHSINGDLCCQGAQQTFDGGYVLTGFTTESDTAVYCSYDFYLFKTDEYGDSIWLKTYGFPGNSDDAYAVQQTTDSGYVLVGICHPTGLEAGDVYVVKTDEEGDTVWTCWIVQEGYDFSYSIDQTGDGGYIVANAYEYYDYQAIRMDGEGDTVWTVVWDEGEHGDDTPYVVCECLDGGFALAGFTSDYTNGPTDACLVKIGTGVMGSLDVSPVSFYHAIGVNDTIEEELLLINEGDGFLFSDIGTTQESDWITIDSTPGWVNPHDTLVVRFTLSSYNLSQRTYFDTLLISSDDSMNPEVRVSVEMMVYPEYGIFVFPNPAFTSFPPGGILTFVNLPANGTIEIYDIAGRLVWKHTFDNPGVLYSRSIEPVGGSPVGSGLYFYHITDSSGSIVKKGKFSVVE
jgi:hypothetical protein